MEQAADLRSGEKTAPGAPRRRSASPAVRSRGSIAARPRGWPAASVPNSIEPGTRCSSQCARVHAPPPSKFGSALLDIAIKTKANHKADAQAAGPSSCWRSVIQDLRSGFGYVPHQLNPASHFMRYLSMHSSSGSRHELLSELRGGGNRLGVVCKLRWPRRTDHRPVLSPGRSPGRAVEEPAIWPGKAPAAFLN